MTQKQRKQLHNDNNMCILFRVNCNFEIYYIFTLLFEMPFAVISTAI